MPVAWPVSAVRTAAVDPKLADVAPRLAQALEDALAESEARQARRAAFSRSVAGFAASMQAIGRAFPGVTPAAASRDVALKLDERVAAEIRRQDGVSTYGVDRDGVRLALACLEDEVDEALEAFQAEKRPIEGRTWSATQGEVVQAVAIGLRLLRDLAAGAERS